MTVEYDWGFRESQAPYYLRFSCYEFPRTSRGRATLSAPVATFVLPGVRINRGTSHRYSEDAPMMENMSQALSTISDSFDVNETDRIKDLGSLMSHVEETFTKLGARYQEDAFGQITSSMGRLELLTTEAGYLGSSKRKYNFNWNLKTLDSRNNSYSASDLANALEKYSMPTVGGFAGEGPISQATRMRPPNAWTIMAEDFDGNDVTRYWFGSPKLCMLGQVMHGLDNQSFIGQNALPFSYNLVANFIELENVFNYNGSIVSRSEFFYGLGQGG